MVRLAGKPASSSEQRARRSPGAKFRSGFQTLLHHARKHIGPGIVCSVAYFDPGNWGVDLQAGSEYGYKLLFVVLVAGIFAVFFQSLATKLGCVTGLDLASHCRLLLYNRSKRPKLVRWLVLYPLYFLTEVAIISTDLAELLGSAIALCMLIPSLPLWAGVLITASDVLILLAIRDPLGGRPMRLFEWIIGLLVLAVFISMSIIISKVSINWAKTFDGFVPSKTVFQSGGLYTSIGIIGATVMPHSLFLGSALATQDRLATSPKKKSLFCLANDSTDIVDTLPTDASEKHRPSLRKVLKSLKDRCVEGFRIAPVDTAAPTRYEDKENNPLTFVHAHLYHGVADIVISLLGFAVLINSFILILSSAVFYYGASSEAEAVAASLFDAQDLIRKYVGTAAATLFALALLCAGQASSIIATMAGQVVCEGFIRWRISPVLRRLLTRCLGLIPSMIVAIAIGRPGVDTLLVASQVVLSIVLPFIVFPLVWLTSSKTIMRVKEPASETQPTANPENPTRAEAPTDVESSVKWVDFSNSKFSMVFGYAVWLLVLAANVYVIVTLALGED